MTQKTFLVFKIITAMALGIIVSLSITHDNWYLPVISVLAAFAFLYFLKNKVKEVMADERDYKIGGKASQSAMTIYVMLSVVFGIILYITGKENEALFAAGNVLLYSACFLMLLYSVLFKIYIKKDERD
jgi:uncharacterized membrane protein